MPSPSNPGPPGFHLLAKPTGATCNLDCGTALALEHNVGTERSSTMSTSRCG
jgi:hypothetical protein